MKHIFKGYYRLTEQEFLEMWKNCLFVVDTNVLLNLYRYPKEAKEDLIRIFKTVSDRIWLPFQVALEFQNNRLSVIANQLKRFSEVKKIVSELQPSLITKLDQLQLKKRHSQINPDPFLHKLGQLIENFLSELDELEKKHPDVYDEDDVRREIDSIFHGKVGSPPESQKYLDEIYKDGKIRFENKVPPGYLDDKDKTGEAYYFSRLIIKRAFGDLLIWKEIIEKAKSTQDIKSIIFLTDDEKDDWWWAEESKGRKIIGPRPELVEELCSQTHVSSFYMYSSLRFMEYAKKYLKVEVQDKSIEQVREVNSSINSKKALHEVAVSAVKTWLKQQRGNFTMFIDPKGNFPDLIVEDIVLEIRVGYEVKAFESTEANSSIRESLKTCISTGVNSFDKNILDQLKIVVVVRSHTDVNKIKKLVSTLDSDTHKRKISILVGTLANIESDEGAFFEFASELNLPDVER